MSLSIKHQFFTFLTHVKLFGSADRRKMVIGKNDLCCFLNDLLFGTVRLPVWNYSMTLFVARVNALVPV